MTVGSSFLAFFAGVLSILSPCVLPILPVVLGAAASEHRSGPIALACGLSTSFVVIGLFLATIGHAIGLNADHLRYVAAALIMVVGAILLLPSVQARLAFAAGPIGNWAGDTLSSARSGGIGGQFLVGVLLGAVWSPCVGPTLGAASLLAAQGHDLPQVAVTMLAFGAGAALPLLALGWLSRETMMRWRGLLLSAGHGMKAALGVLFVAVGALVLSGLDKLIESGLVEASPQWLTNLTTSF
jgi:cytochrome c-type biogenesis protein